ncbi:MAG: FAD-binding oxidoreductase [Alphaproteobacteria bacterium]
MDAISPPADAIRALKDAVGAKGWLDAPAETARYLTDERDLFHGAAPLVLRPDSTAAVARAVALCAAHGIGIVPQGGNTGYVGGATPSADGSQVVLSLERMNRIRAVDPLDNTMVVEAGCVLVAVQAAAAEVDRLFPLSLGAEGSCQIGGNLSTNAGGTQVLRYGNTRDLVLGLEVVLPDGRVWNGLNRLRKNNTGYDLKQLFIGAEGTLGIVTAAVLKLFPAPKDRCVCWLAVPSPQAALALLARMRAATGESVTSFEYIQRGCIDMVLAHVDGTADPLEQRYDHYVLCELTSSRAEAGLRDLAEAAFEQGFGADEILDGTIAASDAQALALWRLRETIPEATRKAGATIKHDVSVAISAVPRFLQEATALAEAELPGVRVTPFGHLGDGNIHFNLSQPAGGDLAAFLAEAKRINGLVHDLVHRLGGSFSAEHGVGALKKAELVRYHPPETLDLLRAVKAAIDPQGLMNPGKML